MDLEDLTAHVVDAGLQIHRGLGPGLLESVYEVVLADSLQRRGLSVERQKPIPIVFNGITFEEGFRADIIVEGLLLNLGGATFKEGIKRIANGNIRR